MAGTHEDATLMVELAKWGAMIDLGAASGIIFGEDFDPETAGMRDEGVQTILVFYETIGTLVKNGLLNQELVLDWLWARGAWDRVGPAVKRAREQLGNAALYENFEALAEGQG